MAAEVPIYSIFRKLEQQQKKIQKIKIKPTKKNAVPNPFPTSNKNEAKETPSRAERRKLRGVLLFDRRILSGKKLTALEEQPRGCFFLVGLSGVTVGELLWCVGSTGFNSSVC
jgi:hypothetical protein